MKQNGKLAKLVQQNILMQIQSQLNTFSKAGKIIAHYILENPEKAMQKQYPPKLFSVGQYRAAYEQLQQYPFDFVIGSVHFVDGLDPYWPQYWQGRTTREAFRVYLEEIYHCVQVHDAFDVLGYLTYVCKSVHNATREPVLLQDYLDITDEIMKILVAKGKGMEINTSGVDRAGVFLPSADHLRRFKELGGQIVTVGSDAHDPGRVGQYCSQAIDFLRHIFGYVCTFENRKPIFHKL